MNLLRRCSVWFSKNPMQRSLYVIVPIVHLLLFIIFSRTSPPKKEINPKKLIVKTFTTSSLEPTSKAATVKSKVSQPQKAAKPPSPIEKKVSSPTPLKKTTSQKSNSQKNTIAKKTEAPEIKRQNLIREKHLKELQERIAKIEAKNDRMPIKSELEVPATLTLSSQQTSKEPAFLKSSLYDENIAASLIGYLQSFLNLPEIGEVQIQIGLHKDGKVETMNVVKADSEKNRKYLEEQLPKISFPQAYLNGSSRSFLLTFCNKF